jgi:hypothetical protein
MTNKNNTTIFEETEIIFKHVYWGDDKLFDEKVEAEKSRHIVFLTHLLASVILVITTFLIFFRLTGGSMFYAKSKMVFI